jgi:pimeloyl-ACP methyl ester carboxylesterase
LADGTDADQVRISLAGHALAYRSAILSSTDGTALAVQDHGVAGVGRDVLFVHGFSQSSLAWLKQTSGPLVAAHRLVTWDLRGHGASGKPDDASAYRDEALWAADVSAVIDGLSLDRPVIVAWSYGGRVTMDFLRHAGSAAISGLVMVAATSNGDPGLLGTSFPSLRAMATARDMGENVVACQALLDACTVTPLSAEEYALALGWNLVAPPSVRLALAGRPADYDDVLAGLRCPTLAIHGEGDQINAMAMSDYFVDRVRGARKLSYAGCGHMPFWEQADRFNADLAEFLQSI